MADMRPEAAAFVGAFGTKATVTLPNGAVLANVDVIRLAPTAGNVNAEIESAVAATRPRFSFPKASVPGLVVQARFAIATGPEAGDFTIDLIEDQDADPDFLEVVATRRR